MSGIRNPSGSTAKGVDLVGKRRIVPHDSGG